jgi:2-polyprenyl-6-methoxyphenol hydroxylase-like FAD-dependent oxidoreductase
MTLATVERYDRGRVAGVGDHAVVVGGSMAGLLAARVLADGFQAVTVLDRDPLPAESVARRGVPQAEHVHAMLEAGRATLEDLFPGFGEAVVSAGGVVIDAATELQYYQKGDTLADGPERLPMYCASRPLFERIVRSRVRALDGVSLRGECHVTDYLSEDGAVEGVRLRDGGDGEETLSAELVVDATGRTSHTPEWLERHHYPPPPVEEVTVDLAYSTVVLDRPPADRRGALVVPSPPLARGGTAVPVEGDRWILTLFGMHGDHPPTDADGLVAFADSLPTPVLRRLLETREWCSAVRHYPFPGSRRRRYESLHRFPDGLVVTGDAVASFNPIYGQGMSVAALDALQLHHALAGGLDGLGPRFFERAADVLDTVWRMTVGADFEFADTEGPKPAGSDLFNRYVDRLVGTAHTDGYVSDRFARVLRLEEPPTRLLWPDVLGRVLLSEVGLRG